MTQRAQTFLSKIGIEVSQPGDETDIPWEVCRPLRLLGDLHFKSESPGSVDTGSIGRSSYSLGKWLPPQHKEQFRGYIQSHPNFTADARRQLRGDVESLSKTFEQSENHTKQDSTGTVPDADEVPSVADADFIKIGQVNRFSNAGNAMVTVDSQIEYNASRLPDLSIGCWMVMTPVRGSYNLCLTPQLWDDEYRESFRNNIKYFEQKTGFDDLGGIQRIWPRSGEKDLEDAVLDVTVIAVRDGIGLAYKGPHTVLVESIGLAPETRLSVQIEETWGAVARARPHLGTGEEATEIGEAVDVELIGENKYGTWGRTKTELIHLPKDFVPVSDRVRVGVSTRAESHLVGSIASLPDSERPVEGEEVVIQNGKLSDYDGLPVRLPSKCPVLETEYRLVVTEITENAVCAEHSPDLPSAISIGDAITVTPQRWAAEEAEAVIAEAPVRIETPRYLPGQELEATISRVSDAGVRAQFERVVSEDQEDGDSFESRFKHAVGHLRAESYGAATTAFATAVDAFESSDIEGPNTLSQARFGELLSFAAAQCAAGDPEVAMRKLDAQLDHNAEHPPISAVQQEVEALKSAVEVHQYLQGIDEMGSSEATEMRSKARKAATTAVEQFDAVQQSMATGTEPDDSGRNWRSLAEQPYPHPVIRQLLHTAIEEMLIAPSSTSAYYDEHGVDDSFFTDTPITETVPEELQDGGDSDDTSQNEDESNDSNESGGDEDSADPLLTARKLAHQHDGEPAEFVERKRNDIATRVPQEVHEYIFLRADGECERCGTPAPFTDSIGDPYLELHHPGEVGDGVERLTLDAETILAICPSCHARIHFAK